MHRPLELALLYHPEPWVRRVDETVMAEEHGVAVSVEKIERSMAAFSAAEAATVELMLESDEPDIRAVRATLVHLCRM